MAMLQLIIEGNLKIDQTTIHRGLVHFFRFHLTSLELDSYKKSIAKCGIALHNSYILGKICEWQEMD